MEFSEKLQELRKARGMTQEELAGELFVSRQAVSKWESGKGYPNIGSLKDISRLFSVSIDDLLSSEELITAAEDENESNILRIRGLLFGIVDILSAALALLPLYPNEEEGRIISVSLLNYSQSSGGIIAVYWILIAALIAAGLAGIIINRIGVERGPKVITAASLGLGALTVLFIIAGKAPYAASLAFLLLAAKAVLARKMK